MSKRIKHVSELPDWFHLDKYNRSKELDATGWVEQLNIRRDYLSSYINILADQDEYFKEALRLIRENPIVDTTSNDLLRVIFYGGALTELKLKKPHYSLGLHSMTLREFFMTKCCIKPEKLQYIEKWWKQFQNNSFLKRKKIRYRAMPWIDEPIYTSFQSSSDCSTAICVNFSLPDNILIEHFKQYLTRLRSETNHFNPTKQRRQDFNDWQRFGVLPYLDLKIWEREISVTIPNRVIADAIFQPGEGGEETVRKTTIPLAKLLLADKSMQQLIAQAAFEIAERNSS